MTNHSGFIRLTKTGNRGPVYIDPWAIPSIETSDDIGSLIVIGNRIICVDESPDEILDLIEQTIQDSINNEEDY